jgi:hypothetical protein
MHRFDGWFVVFNATLNNISVISPRSVLLVEETGVPGEKHLHRFNDSINYMTYISQ